MSTAGNEQKQKKGGKKASSRDEETAEDAKSHAEQLAVLEETRKRGMASLLSKAGSEASVGGLAWMAQHRVSEEEKKRWMAFGQAQLEAQRKALPSEQEEDKVGRHALSAP